MVTGALVLLTGRSFSGKSTVASALADRLDASVVSYDAINAERGLDGGAGIPVEEWVRTGGIAHERARAGLAAGRTVVVDDTSSPRFLRDEWRTLAASAGARFRLVLVDADEAEVRRRHAANRLAHRRPDVADAVLTAHLDAFVPPEADEPHVRIAPDLSPDAVAAAVRAALVSEARA